MKKAAFITCLFTLFCLCSWGQNVPEGATLLYYSNTRGSNNGVYLRVYTIYQQSGKTYMRRSKGFAGAITEARTKSDKIYYLPEVTFQLSGSQLKNICEWLKATPFQSLSKACNDEEERNGEPQPVNVFVWGMGGPTHHQQVIEWPGVMTGVRTDVTTQFEDYGKEEHRRRTEYLKAKAEFDEKLEEIGYKYVKKHINKLWKEWHAEK